jgi:hypothetical protein
VFLILAAVVVLAAGYFSGASTRRAAADDLTEDQERRLPFALRDLDLTPQAAQEVDDLLRTAPTAPRRPLRRVPVQTGPLAYA